MKLVTVEQMRLIEKEANENGISYDLMMERAGKGIAKIVLNTYSQIGKKKVLGLVGSGNNGGDTLITLEALAQAGWMVKAYLVRPRSENDPILQRVLGIGGSVEKAENDPELTTLDKWLGDTTVLLDGVLGTGVQFPLNPELARILAHVREYQHLPHILAVDCPSGVDCDSGAAAGECIPAEMTACMQAVKTGMLAFPAYQLVGEIRVVDLDLPRDLPSWQAVNRTVVGKEDVKSILPERKADAHKGTFGIAMVVAGSINYTGAAFFAAKAAYRIGAGLVRLAVPGPLHSILAGQLPEATWLILPHEMGVISSQAEDILRQNLEKVSAMLLGPGWGLEETTAEFLEKLIVGEREQSRRAGFGFVATEPDNKLARHPFLPALVIDADGLKLLQRIQDWFKKLPGQAILTPHPGEMEVLTGKTLEEIQLHRLEIAEQSAREWGHVVVLKGAFTIIADPSGRTGVIPVATAALARAGTGDVLAGLIVGLRAQGVQPYEAAITGAWIHAQAGLAACRRLGHAAAVMAGDVLDAVPEVLRQL